MTSIIIDHRESQVIPFLLDIAKGYGFTTSVKSLNVGDYAILINNKIICIIERKTWKDIAASFKDGRKGNIAKLRGLREDTGCRIIYMMEGVVRNKSPTAITEYKRSVSHLDHLMIRDNVHVMYSKDSLDTAQKICSLSKNISTLDSSVLKKFVPFNLNSTDIKDAGDEDEDENKSEKVDEKVSDEIDEIDEIDEKVSDEAVETNDEKHGSVSEEVDKKNEIDFPDEKENIQDNQNSQNNQDNQDNQDAKVGGDSTHLEEGVLESNVDCLYKKYKPESTSDVQELMLKCLPGVGEVKAKILFYNGVTIKNLIQNMYSKQQISDFKVPGIKASIGKSLSEKILTTISSLGQNSKISYQILSMIDRISEKTAKEILKNYNLIDLVTGSNNCTEEMIKRIKISKTTMIKRDQVANLLKALR